MPSRSETIRFGTPSRRLHVRNRNSGLLILVDTGSDVSLLPFQPGPKHKLFEILLFDTNNTKISTFVEKRVSLDLGLRLVVDLARRKLIDSITDVSANFEVRRVDFCSVSTIDCQMLFAEILAKYPEITGGAGFFEFG